MLPDRLIGAFNPAAQSLFKQGLKELAPAKVSEAISYGADVATHNPDSTWGNSIAFLFMSVRSAVTITPSSNCLGDREADFDAIIDLILHEDPNLLEKNNWGKNAADYAVSSPLPHIAAKVVLHAIRQCIHDNEPVYQINFDAIFSALGKGSPRYKTRDRVMDAIEHVHDQVRQKLLAPENDPEIDLVRNHSDKIGFWLTPFQRPDHHLLPFGGRQIDVALIRLNEQARHLLHAGSAEKPACTAALHDANANLTRAIINQTALQAPKNTPGS